MAWTAVRAEAELEAPFVLTPERYDPRRGGSGPAGVPLGRLVGASRRTVTSADDPDRVCVVLDTSDAREGRVAGRKPVQTVGDIGSVKKLVEPGDVIISRLRPYLRQVAYVDVAARPAGTLLLASTEFHVLRPADHRSIAFLVPFLLSGPVQTILAAAQEGGHHPRFNEATLLGLSIPTPLLATRDTTSEAVEKAIRMSREADELLFGSIAAAEASGDRTPVVGTAIESIGGDPAEG